MQGKGWSFGVAGARKFHYFGDDGRSLCGRYGSFGVPSEAFEPETGLASKDDCAACRRKVDTAQQTDEFPTCSTCGERNVEDAGDHAERTGHWPRSHQQIGSDE